MKKFIILGLVFFLTSNIVFGQDSSDPYKGMRYDQAFNQTDLYEKYKNLIYYMNCQDNIFEYSAESVSVNLTLEEYQKELKNFETECLDRLNKARLVPIMKPAVASVLTSTLKAGAMVAAFMYMKKSKDPMISMVGSVYSNIFQYIGLIGISHEIVNVAHNLFSKPNNSIGYLEEYFVKNKCYIPNVLWPKITNAFILARENGYSTDFLQFILNFTVNKPKDVISCKKVNSINEVKKELRERIKLFFQSYEKFNNLESLSYIQINVEKFIDELIEYRTSGVLGQGPRYIYLHGVGGIGKTHFVQTLASWIEELLPNSVIFEELVINSAIELEGNDRIPGALLKVLRNQLMQSKRGSIIMFDEASWFNDPTMISSVKRVFNGDRSKLSSAFFGVNIDGSMVSFSMPPMLIFVAANDKINDEALASRFDLVFYPNPTKKALYDYALDIIDKSNILKNYEINNDPEKVEKWINNLSKDHCNFRYVASNIEGLLLQNI